MQRKKSMDIHHGLISIIFVWWDHGWHLFVCFSIFSNFPTIKVKWVVAFVFVFNSGVRVSSKKKKEIILSQSKSYFAHRQNKWLYDLQFAFFLGTPDVIYVFLLDNCVLLLICLSFFICITCLYKRNHQIQAWSCLLFPYNCIIYVYQATLLISAF